MSDDQPQDSVVKTPPTEEERKAQLETLRATPGFDKLLELFKHLDEYDDFSSKMFDDFPRNLPRRLTLKLGRKVIGKAIVDWEAVGGHLFALFLDGGKPPEMPDDEYLRQLRDYFRSLDPREVSEFVLPSFAAMWHMMEFLPEKLNDAIVHLAVEGRQKQVIKRQQELGAEIPSPAKFADEIAKLERDAIKKRLPKKQPSKTKPAWQSEENLKRFAERVLARQLLCQCMKNIYDRCDFLEDWADDLTHNEDFKLLSKDVAEEAIAWAIRQIGDDKITPRDKEPVPVACEIARRELDLPLQEIQTLNGYYLEGVKLLRDARRAQKSLAKSALPSRLSAGEVDSGDSFLTTSKPDNVDPQ